jgi:FMN reductase
MAAETAEALKANGADAEFVDLREVEMPLCSGVEAESVTLDQLREKIRGASAVILAAPIYNYDVNAAAKNLVEMTGAAWRGKVVGFLCAAGGHSSYMSLMGFANSLMLDFRCWIVPRFVYAAGKEGDIETPLPAELRKRLEQLAETTLHAAESLYQK